MDLVLADDFSGAAEISGIAARDGRKVEFSTDVPDNVPGDIDVLIIDTDTRLLKPAEAARRVEEICSRVSMWRPARVFKKIDSVMRGPVPEEIEAAMRGLDLERAVVCSANPSKDRVIKDGQYYVGGTLLHETAFADDPLHPATTSSVHERFGNSSNVETPNATSEEEIRAIVDELQKGTLVVGAADFFRFFLGAGEASTGLRLPIGSRLWICGSQVVRVTREEGFRTSGIPIVLLDPEELDSQALVDEIVGNLSGVKKVAMELDGAVQITPENTDQLLRIVTEISAVVLKRGEPRVIFTEGGATARTVIDAAGWTEFSVFGELAPGVVVLEPKNAAWPVLVVVKPGSYPWPKGIFLDQGGGEAT